MKIVLTSQDPSVIAATQLFAQAHGLTFEVVSNVTQFPTQEAPQTVAQMEQELVLKAINHAKGNMSEAAKTLGLGRATLYRKMKEFGLQTKEFRKKAA